MAAASYFIIKALTELGIRASETSLQADEIQDGLDALNDLLAEVEPILQLGFSPVQGITNEVRIPRNANRAVYLNLAIALGPQYSRPVSAALAGSADAAFKNLLNAQVFIGDVDMPDTLPQGSGNQWCDNDVDDARFFPQKDKRNF